MFIIEEELPIVKSNERNKTNRSYHEDIKIDKVEPMRVLLRA